MGRKFTLSRRAMLRGVAGGAALAVGLPALEIMLNPNGTRLADGAPLPKRFMTWFFGNGVRKDRWIPSAQGAAYPLSEEMAPLANVRDYVSVLSGFQNYCEDQITHHEGMTVFNGYTFDQQGVGGLYSKPGGPTIDQVIAATMAGQTVIPSVHVGVSKRLSIMDSGTTMHVLSHKGTNEPQPPQFNPQAVWTQLFGSFTPPNDPSGPLRVKVLDAVRGQTAALRKRLGTLDNQRLDAHLEGVDSLQTKIEALPPLCTKPDMPDETNTDVNGVEPITSVNAAMSDLLAYAFSCDITRVASFMFIGGAAETNFSEIGQNNGHHDNTHQASQTTQNVQVHGGVVYIMEKLAYMLEKFQATADGTGNLLDSSLVYVSSDCGEGYWHDIFDQPILVCGHGRNSVVHPGVHYRSPNGENTTNVLVSMLQAFDPVAAAAGVGAGQPFSNTPCAALAP
jgi:hypothetical protein